MCLFLNTGNLLKTNTRLKSSSLSCQGDNSESVSPPTSASVSSCIYMEPNILILLRLKTQKKKICLYQFQRGGQNILIKKKKKKKTVPRYNIITIWLCFFLHMLTIFTFIWIIHYLFSSYQRLPLLRWTDWMQSLFLMQQIPILRTGSWSTLMRKRICWWV